MENLPLTWIEDCRTLLNDIEDLPGNRENVTESFKVFQNIAKRASQSSVDDENATTRVRYLQDYIQALTSYANDALDQESDDFTDLIEELAIATRNSELWRDKFGGLPQHAVEAYDSTKVPLPKPDCILEIARRVCTLKYHVTSQAITYALKIIANCCGDNNSNRRIIVRRNGIDAILQLGLHGTDLNVLVPTLYNVCVDYDEPASFSPIPISRVSQPDSGELEATAEDEPASILSLAVQQLAASHRSNEEFMTFQLLLSFQSRIDEHICPYLAELVEMATEPATFGYEHICTTSSQMDNIWSFVVHDTTYDTVQLMATIVSKCIDTLLHLCRATVNLLSQQKPLDNLLKRDDDSMWTLLTLPCLGNAQEIGDLEDELITLRPAFLKILYQITSLPAFGQNEARVSSLMEKCIAQLETRISTCSTSGQIWLRDDPSYQNPSDTSSRNDFVDRQSVLLASACVILSQLAASVNVRDRLVFNNRLLKPLLLLLSSEKNPNVLYPAATIVSRICLSPEPNPSFVTTNGLSIMQRLLTQKGLGLIVPYETVAAYRTIVRGRAHVIGSLLQRSTEGNSIVEDMFVLYDLTIEAGTKLEIGKFLLEIFRAILTETAKVEHDKQNPVFDQIKAFLTQSSSKVAEIFAWVCTKAEPSRERDHGFFALAMLSTWEEGKPGILHVLDHDEDLRDTMLRVSPNGDSLPAKNLKVVLNTIIGTSLESQLSGQAIAALRTVAENIRTSSTSEG